LQTELLFLCHFDSVPNFSSFMMGLQFQVILIGKNFEQTPIEFEKAKQRLGDKIIQYGYAESFADYTRLLWRADILPVTSYHDLFGISVVEAIYYAFVPLQQARLSYPELLLLSDQGNYFYQACRNL